MTTAPAPRRPLLRLLTPLLLLAAGTAAFRLPPPDEDVLRRIVQGVQRFYSAALPEKAYLHLDRAWYTAGETIWFKAYVVDAARHEADTLSKVLHVELLNGAHQLVARRQLLLEAGLAPGDIVLPDTLTPGSYTLRAYTGWMRNAGPDFFFSRRLAIWPAAPGETPAGKPATPRPSPAARKTAPPAGAGPDVQFFPEGGNLVAGLENVVAFKATDYAARGLDVQGQVLDEQGKPVVSFRSRHLGMGSFVLTPAAGQRYRAVVTPAGAEPVTVPLPAVQASGYTIHVTTLSSDFLVGAQQQGGSGGPVLLVGQVRGTVAYVGRGQMTGGEPFFARIPKSQFPTGIVHFTLFDGQGNPLAERLAFAQNEPALRVSLTPDRASYRPRQPVRVRVAVADAAGKPVATRLSLAVTDAGGVSADAQTIASHLLLTSDLAGYVENPGYYFQNPTPETAQHLDALLLTQGWRRFAWKPVLADQAPVRDFRLERDLGLLGQVLQPNGKPAPGSQLIFLETAPEKRMLSATADAEGRFLFTGLGGCDTTRVTLQARKASGRAMVLRLDPGPPRPNHPLPLLPPQPAAALADAVSRSRAQRATERRFQLDTTKTIMLGGVTVKGTRAAPRPDNRRLYSPANATVLKTEEFAGNASLTVVQALQGRLPGVLVTGSGPTANILIRGVNSLSGDSTPLLLLDGVPVTMDVLAYYPVSDTEAIEILKGGQAAIYGSRASGGVVAVYTRRGNPNYNHAKDPAPGVAALRLPGYNCPREFYVPRYEAANTNRAYPDPRQATLYWNPTVRTDAAGQAEVKFFTSDATGAFELRAEGLSGAGQPALGSGRLRVE